MINIIFSLIGFLLRHLPFIAAIVIFSLWVDFSFIRLFLFIWIFSAIYETILWQFPEYILIRKSIPSQMNTLELKILHGNITIKERSTYFIWKLISCLFDLKYIAGTLIVCALFTIGYYIMVK